MHAPTTTQRHSKNLLRLKSVQRDQRIMIPIEHTQMKIIRENEIYLMEEAVTNNILKEASQIIDLHNESQELMSSQFMLSSDGFTSPHPIESGPTSPIS